MNRTHKSQCKIEIDDCALLALSYVLVFLRRSVNVSVDFISKVLHKKKQKQKQKHRKHNIFF